MVSEYGAPICTSADGSATTCVIEAGVLPVDDAASEDASEDAADSGSAIPDAGDAEPTEDGSAGAVVPPTDGGEAGR
jgi:hypothetical protein